jgi:hypothetical protein
MLERWDITKLIWGMMALVPIFGTFNLGLFTDNGKCKDFGISTNELIIPAAIC